MPIVVRSFRRRAVVSVRNRFMSARSVPSADNFRPTLFRRENRREMNLTINHYKCLTGEWKFK